MGHFIKYTIRITFLDSNKKVSVLVINTFVISNAKLAEEICYGSSPNF